MPEKGEGFWPHEGAGSADLQIAGAQHASFLAERVLTPDQAAACVGLNLAAYFNDQLCRRAKLHGVTPQAQRAWEVAQSRQSKAEGLIDAPDQKILVLT